MKQFGQVVNYTASIYEANIIHVVNAPQIRTQHSCEKLTVVTENLNTMNT